MKTIKVRIEGMTPYLMHRFSDNSEADKATRRIKVTQPSPREEAERVAYKNEDGTFYFNAYAIVGTLGNAGVNHKMRGSRKSLKFIVPSAVRVATDKITVLNGNGPAKNFEVDSRPVTIPATKGRIMRHRPRFDKWSAEFDLIVNEKLLDPEQVHILLNEAGESIGIGDFRPEKRGPFGTFRVVKFKEE
jgi:hypothetical protein